MQNKISSNSKLLKSTVIRIAIFLIAYFSSMVILIPFFEKAASGSLIINSCSFFIGALVCFFTMEPVERAELIYNKKAVFAGKPYYLLYILILSISLTVAINFIFYYIPWDLLPGDHIVQDNEKIFSTPLSLQLAFYIVMIPFAEEMLFRGLIFARLRKIIAFPVAALLTGLIFGIYHQNLMQGTYAFIQGTILCLVFHFGGSMFYSVLFHAAANCISVLVMAYPNVYNKIYSPLVITLSFIYIVVAIILSITLKNKLTKKDK